MILDARVAAALGWNTEGSWTSTDYRDYLELAPNLADELGTTPHVVEHALFWLRRTARNIVSDPALTVRDLDPEVIAALRAARRDGETIGQVAARVLQGWARR